ncbi:MAG: hypothetical protein GF421_01405 [Candidatus Aminicenantes bacterium]|nr:hypothetical protein [Candidatus Aminicenantes bacterium]
MSEHLRRLKYFFSMLQNQRLSYRKLREIQNRKLKALIHNSYYQVPYFQDLMDSVQLKPQQIQSPKDLQKIPVTTKKDLQSCDPSYLMDKRIKPSQCRQVTTSGSTGMPLKFYYSKPDFSRLSMSWLRPLLFHGVKPWHRKLEITGPHNISETKKWYQHVGLFKTQGISVFKTPSDWVRAWNAFQPDFLYGYSGSLKLFAKHIMEQGIENVNPKYIFGVSDLVDIQCREWIHSAFDKKIIDLYGSVEAGCIAWECSVCQGYHINMDTAVVEILKNGHPVQSGSSGNLFITNLHSFAFPIIRYDLGDIARLSESKPVCSLPLPLMQVIEGRSDAEIILPSGNSLSPMFFFGIMKPFENIIQWRVVQEQQNHLKIFIVPHSDFKRATLNLIQMRIQRNIEEDIQIKINLTERLRPDKSGKIRSVVSKIK